MQEISYFHKSTKLIGSFYPIKNAPTLILFPAFEGPSLFCHDYAKKLNGDGFSVFIADMYGNKKVENTLDECMTQITPFLDSRILVRDRALAAFEACSQLSDVNPNLLGAFGFYFGGMCTLELARSGANLKGFASLHGILTKSDLPSYKILGDIFIMHGFLDPQSPPDCFASFCKEMKSLNFDKWQFLFFGDAKHSFTDPQTGSFDPLKEKAMGREYNLRASLNSYSYLRDFFKNIFN
jgi:dienelactone hydrolase